MSKATPQIVQVRPAILRRDGAAAFLGISTSLLERLVAQGRMPKPRQISDGTSGWLVSELDAAAHALPVSELLPVPAKKAAAAAS